MKKIKLIYKKDDEWDYVNEQKWSCLYTLDRGATMRANDDDVLLDYINDDVVIYTDDITDDELDALDGAGYDLLSWGDYDYYCYAGDIEDWAGYYEIPCKVDGDDAIINVTVDDSGHIVRGRRAEK